MYSRGGKRGGRGQQHAVEQQRHQRGNDAAEKGNGAAGLRARAAEALANGRAWCGCFTHSVPHATERLATARRASGARTEQPCGDWAVL